jgi:hypothetical protein
VDFEGTTTLAIGIVPVFGYVQDLTTYPSWFTIVDRVAPARHADPAEPAWDVDLAARLGPLKRTKRVRMVRSALDLETHHARFERREADEGRSHSAWVLDGQVTDDGVGGCVLRMHLHYGGIAWVPGLDLLLREEAKRAAARLERVLRAHGHG